MTDGSEDYYKSYGGLEVHRTMLTDAPRMKAYLGAIRSNLPTFANARVMDVGSGTGIIALWVALYTECEKVFAVEANQKMATIIGKMAAANGVSDKIVVLDKRVEDVQLSDIGNKVDIVISEWMGHYLLHESMLDSVLFARDNFLKSEGLMFPERATIYASFVALQRPDFYDFNSSLLGGVNILPLLNSQKLPAIDHNQPFLHHVDSSCMVDFSSREKILELNLAEVRASELDSIHALATLTMIKESHTSKVSGVCIWFDVSFPANEDNISVRLSTGPVEEYTHWKQCVILFEEEPPAVPHMTITMSIEFSRKGKDDRAYSIELEVIDTEVVE